MNTSAPRLFSSIWNETSESGNRFSRACPGWTPRNSATSFANSGCARPEKSFSSPNPLAMNGSPIDVFVPGTPPAPRSCFAGTPTPRSAASRIGWGGRIRTFEYGIQSPAPYRLATPQRNTASGLRRPTGRPRRGLVGGGRCCAPLRCDLAYLLLVDRQDLLFQVLPHLVVERMGYV